LTMAQNCMNRFEKTRLPAQAMVEQNCATRTTPEGQKPKTLVEEMVPLLDANDVSNADKVRIIALYIMYSDGVPDEDRRRLFQHARLGMAEMDAVNNLIHLGARVLKDPQNSGWDAWFKKGKRKQITGENEYELSRYQPLVKLMLEDHYAGKLEQSTYPYVRDGPPETGGSGVSSMVGGASGLVSSAIGGRDSPLSRHGSSQSSMSNASNRMQPSSLRSAKPTWHQKGRPAAGVGGGGGGGSGGGSYSSSYSDRGDGNRQRVIVFIAGGMTFSEVRSTYQVSEKLGKDVYMGEW
jgi:syntaxin-binding protein 1